MSAPHPDAELLALCHRLQDMQAEWQRLYDATSDEPRLTTTADHAWDDYTNHVWPGIRIASSIFHKQPHPDDQPGQLLRLPATTPEGQAAKAAAILALDEVAGYCDLRDDSIEMMHSLLRDVAGIETHHLGADAPKVVPCA
ncbi:MAG: hypothetical protein ACRYG8_26960 [Janthinobacterium lividum]